MAYERPYYRDLDYHPFLFYVIFNVEDTTLNISRNRHHVEEVPKGLNTVIYNKMEHREYMDSLMGGSLGNLLRENNPMLYDKAVASEKWAVIRGKIENDNTLDYMRDTIGIVQAFVDTGAVAVLDLLTFSLFDPSEWTDHIFMGEFNPYSHVIVLSSNMSDGTEWLHTRGMMKYGRPDIGVTNVSADDREDAMQVINQIIYYGSMGVFLDQATKLHTHTGKTFLVHPNFVNDFDNEDYNNSYYDISWTECEEIKE